MGKITGFMEFTRQDEGYLEPAARLKNYKEFVLHLSDPQAKVQAARCMDCGIPFCNNGCPVNNIIPDWNDLVYHGHYRAALDNLHRHVGLERVAQGARAHPRGEGRERAALLYAPVVDHERELGVEAGRLALLYDQ